MERASLTPLGTVTFPSVRTYAVKVASFFNKKPPKNTLLNDYRRKRNKKTVRHLLGLIHLLKNDDRIDTWEPFLWRVRQDLDTLSYLASFVSLSLKYFYGLNVVGDCV